MVAARYSALMTVPGTKELREKFGAELRSVREAPLSFGVALLGTTVLVAGAWWFVAGQFYEARLKARDERIEALELKLKERGENDAVVGRSTAAANADGFPDRRLSREQRLLIRDRLLGIAGAAKVDIGFPKDETEPEQFAGDLADALRRAGFKADAGPFVGGHRQGVEITFNPENPTGQAIIKALDGVGVTSVARAEPKMEQDRVQVIVGENPN